jgi:hypothetical protein
VAEVSILGAGCHHERVVVDRRFLEQHAPALEIEARHLAEYNARVGLALENPAQR